ncbi:hypothetical protein BDV96DRAFT_564324 [Lophiotrema nucula]|uniref:Family c-likeg-protein-coupled receptor protein n=1 Tax=Lophiotrema nucula TaxID=690887 RepID=A0A6A5ZT56_9PLEO|nr:hypothetical protein BDV96DRAFT_564324 [Lophiotrema nucula]
MAPQGSTQNQGPPWAPFVWALGGIPEKNVDIPITAVFLFLFIVGAAIHMTIFQLNRRRRHKFLPNALLFGFCMARIATCVLRIASISLPTDAQLAIAASIFVAAGVLIIFIINLIFAQRIIRSLHPMLGWHIIPSYIVRVLYVLIGLTLAVVITATVQSFYTLRPRTRTIDRGLQLYGSTFLCIVSFLPIPFTIGALVLPRKGPHEKFGQGRLRTKVLALLTGSTLVCLGAAYRCGTSWKQPVPRTQPMPAYFHKAAFYIFNFAVEILTVYLYAIIRVDLRFWIPNGAKGPGSYEAQRLSEKQDVELGGQKQNEEEGMMSQDSAAKVESEEKLGDRKVKRQRSKEEEQAVIDRLGGPPKKTEV